ncbi:DJ-1/PfpI family protein [Candidatus Mycoplasma pogonae]
MKLLVLVLDDFQDVELVTVLGVLDAAKVFKQVDYYNPDHKHELLGQHKVAFIKTTVQNVKVNDYDAIFIPGGRAAVHLRSNEAALNLVASFKVHKKAIFAICDAPNVLFEAGIIDKTTSYCAYPIENQIKGKNYLAAPCHIADRLITARGPFSSFDLALAIIEKYQGQVARNKIEKRIKGIVD